MTEKITASGLVDNDPTETIETCKPEWLFGPSMWGVAQRAGMQIAGIPGGVRHAALDTAESFLRDMAYCLPLEPHEHEAFVELHMSAIRYTVRIIDLSGYPQGGWA